MALDDEEVVVLGDADRAAAVSATRDRVLGETRLLEPGADEARIGEHLRGDILSSWQRCHKIGVAPSGDDVPYNPEFERPSRLLRAATPVLDRLAEQLLDGPASILLADSQAQIISRRAGGRQLAAALDRALIAPGFYFSEEATGTNGLGSTLEERRPFVVNGAEHFRDNLHEFTCIGAPLVHPVTGAVEGALDLTCRVQDANVLMKPLITAAVREIESRMYADSSLRERMLLESFLAVSRRTTAAVVALNQDVLISNTAASKLLESSDQALLWDWASRMLGARDECSGEIRLARDIVVHARAKRVDTDRRLAGVLVEMRAQPRCTEQGQLPRPARAGRRTGERPGPASARTSSAGPALPGRSAASARLRRELVCIAESGLPALLTGEDGSGRLFAARHLHLTARPDEPFTVLDARLAAQDAAVWLERFRTQVGSGIGTIVLRHLEALPEDLRARVEAELDATAPGRVQLVATARVERPHGPAGRLADRFPASTLVAPLRYRVEDIADIAPVLLRRHSQTPVAPRLQPVTLQALLGLDWPGNIRELEAVLTSALLGSMGSDITPAHLPPAYRSARARRHIASLERAERDVVLQALADTGGNKLATARRLGIARSTLYRKMRVFGIDPNRIGR